MAACSYSRKRKIHDFHDPRLEKAVAGHAMLLGNNSRIRFSEVEMLVPDEAQVELLLSGKPIE